MRPIELPGLLYVALILLIGLLPPPRSLRRARREIARRKAAEAKA